MAYKDSPPKFIGRAPAVPEHPPTPEQITAYLRNRDRDPQDRAERRKAVRELHLLELRRTAHCDALTNRTHSSTRGPGQR